MFEEEIIFFQGIKSYFEYGKKEDVELIFYQIMLYVNQMQGLHNIIENASWEQYFLIKNFARLVGDRQKFSQLFDYFIYNQKTSIYFGLVKICKDRSLSPNWVFYNKTTFLDKFENRASLIDRILNLFPFYHSLGDLKSDENRALFYIMTHN